MSDQNILDVDVSHTLGSFSLNARFNVSGGIAALFGRSGAGKSTIINILSGLIRPQKGVIRLAGRTLFDSDRAINLPPEQRRIGCVFQDSRLFPHLNVLDNLRYGEKRTRRQGKERTPRHDFDDVVDLLDLSSFLARRPRTLSGGEKQRVAIGRALLSDPDLLLMDEPLSSLDAARKAEILPFIERLRDQFAVPMVYVSHALEEVVRLSDVMALVSEGSIIASGSVGDIMARLDLSPYTGRYEAGAVIEARIGPEDPAFGLEQLVFGQNRLWVPVTGGKVGDTMRVRVRARDVSLSLERPTGISMLNVFEGTIVEVREDDGPQTDVLVDVGVPLIARVTRKSVVELGLVPGKRIYALAKTVALDRHSLGGVGADPRRV